MEDMRQICYIRCEISPLWKHRRRLNGNKKNFRSLGCEDLRSIQLAQDIIQGELL
jgi:hypothetical protein